MNNINKAPEHNNMAGVEFNNEIEEEEKDLENEGMIRNNSKPSTKVSDDSTRPCLETIMKIIDVGLDKNYEDFMHDISLIASPLVKITETFSVMASVGVKDTPITSYRNLLKPVYVEKRKISVPVYDNDNLIIPDREKIQGYFNLYESYKYSVEKVYLKYFSHLEDREKRLINFYKDFRCKFILLEDPKVMSSFIDQIYNIHRIVDDGSFLNESDYLNLWSKFMNDKNEFELNFILYLIPQEIIVQNQHGRNDRDRVEEIPLLSEFLANNDHIYKIIVFNPWSVPRDNDITEYLNKMNEMGKGDIDFPTPGYSDIYSYLKLPLDLYVAEANKIFNLNLYKISGPDRKLDKLFWRGVDIIFDSNPKKEVNKNKKNESKGHNNVTIT
jgi:hypothetical protein